jgi:hypothetical protein
LTAPPGTRALIGVNADRRCRASAWLAGLPATTHMMGGIMAWKQAHLPTVTRDPAAGTVRDRR